MGDNGKKRLERIKPPTNIKLSLLWTALMFLYIYNDYFSMYMPGSIEDMLAGRMGPLGEATEMIMVGVSLMLAIPALMIYLSAALPPAASRVLNVILGLAYTFVQILTFFGSALFYQIVVGLEVAVTLLIVWTALTWPKEADGP